MNVFPPTGCKEQAKKTEWLTYVCFFFIAIPFSDGFQEERGDFKTIAARSFTKLAFITF